MGGQPFELEDGGEGFTGRLQGEIIDGRIVYVTGDGHVIVYDEGNLRQWDTLEPLVNVTETLPSA